VNALRQKLEAQGGQYEAAAQELRRKILSAEPELQMAQKRSSELAAKLQTAEQQLSLSAATASPHGKPTSKPSTQDRSSETEPLPTMAASEGLDTAALRKRLSSLENSRKRQKQEIQELHAMIRCREQELGDMHAALSSQSATKTEAFDMMKQLLAEKNNQIEGLGSLLRERDEKIRFMQQGGVLRPTTPVTSRTFDASSAARSLLATPATPMTEDSLFRSNLRDVTRRQEKETPLASLAPNQVPPAESDLSLSLRRKYMASDAAETASVSSTGSAGSSTTGRGCRELTTSAAVPPDPLTSFDDTRLRELKRQLEMARQERERMQQARAAREARATPTSLDHLAK
jgi:hypothetical protein